jgi:hypothetical protein
LYPVFSFNQLSLHVINIAFFGVGHVHIPAHSIFLQLFLPFSSIYSKLFLHTHAQGLDPAFSTDSYSLYQVFSDSHSVALHWIRVAPPGMLHVHLPVAISGFGGLGSGGVTGLLGCGLGVQFFAWFVAFIPLQFRVCPSLV